MMKIKFILLVITLFFVSCEKKLSYEEELKIKEEKSIDSLLSIAQDETYVHNYEKMIAAYSEVLKIQDYNEEALGNRALAYQNIREFEKAIRDYSNLIDLINNKTDKEPNHIGFNYLSRAECKFELRDYRGALSDLEEAEDNNCEVQDVYVNRAYSYLNLGDTENACINFSKAGDKGFKNAYEEIAKYCN